METLNLDLVIFEFGLYSQYLKQANRTYLCVVQKQRTPGKWTLQLDKKGLKGFSVNKAAHDYLPDLK